GAVVALGQQRPARIEGLVAATRVGIGDDRVHHDLVAVLVEPGGIAAEHDGEPVLGDAHPAECPDVVMVQRGRLYRDRRPPVRAGWLRAVAQFEPGQRIISVNTHSSRSKHAPHPTKPGGRLRSPAPARRLGSPRFSGCGVLLNLISRTPRSLTSPSPGWDWGEWDVWGLAAARRRQPAGAEMVRVREPGVSRVADV